MEWKIYEEWLDITLYRQMGLPEITELIERAEVA